MLEKPELEDEEINNCLRDEYGLSVGKITYLPLGADLITAVYRVVTNDGTAYFVKLRRGVFNEASVAVPNFLSDQGIKQIIPSLTTQTGQLWANLNPFKMILTNCLCSVIFIIFTTQSAAAHKLPRIPYP